MRVQLGSVKRSEDLGVCVLLLSFCFSPQRFQQVSNSSCRHEPRSIPSLQSALVILGRISAHFFVGYSGKHICFVSKLIVGDSRWHRFRCITLLFLVGLDPRHNPALFRPMLYLTTSCIGRVEDIVQGSHKHRLLFSSCTNLAAIFQSMHGSQHSVSVADAISIVHEGQKQCKLKYL